MITSKTKPPRPKKSRGTRRGLPEKSKMVVSDSIWVGEAYAFTPEYLKACKTLQRIVNKLAH